MTTINLTRPVERRPPRTVECQHDQKFPSRGTSRATILQPKSTPWNRVVLVVTSLVALLASLAVAGPAAGAYASTGGQSVATQARAVHNLAELREASPAVRHLIQTPVGGSFTRIPTTVGPPEATPDVGNSGWSALPYPGCWSWNVYYSAYNALGWTLFTIGFNNVNDCWTGTELR
jgi:hypothetical protein